MKDQTAPQPPAVLLSREELLVVLDSLQARFIPGLDADPLGELTPEGQELALTVARRALQARDLAQTGHDGQFLVHRLLLNAVGLCAYSQSAVVAFHWPTGSGEAVRFFGHLRSGDAVIHTRPADVLHRFALQPSKDALIGELLAFCECEDAAGLPEDACVIARDSFARARELAGGGSVGEATRVLVEAGLAPEAGAALAGTLAGSPRVSVVQTLKQMGDQAVQSREFTLIQDGGQAWWVMPAAEAGQGPLTVKPTSRAQIGAAVAEWV